MFRRLCTIFGGMMVATVAVLTPSPAMASTWNHVYGTAYTTWHHESFVRSVTNNTNVYIKCSSIPSGGLGVKLGNAKYSDYRPFTSQVNVTALNVQYTVATNVLSGTKFVLWTLKLGSGSNSAYDCQLYY